MPRVGAGTAHAPGGSPSSGPPGVAPREWAGSNVDLGEFHDVSEALRDSSVKLDDALAEARACEAELEDAQALYFRAFARAVVLSTERTNSARERDAKTKHVEERIRFEAAQLRYKLALLAVEVAQDRKGVAQSRGAMLRAQMFNDGGTPGEWYGHAKRPRAKPKVDW